MSNSSATFCAATRSAIVCCQGLARECGASVVATNDALYHSPERYKLQHALVAVSRNTTIDGALPHINPNDRLHLKSAAQMRRMFRHCPEAIDNTLKIADAAATST